MLPHQLKVVQSLLSSLTQPTKGAGGTANPKQPAQPLKLFDIEACPYCRRVRQALTMLNLDVEVYPCPKNGSRYRPVAEQLKGDANVTYPLLWDENTGEVLMGSQTIIDHLFKLYGKTGTTPKAFKNLPQFELTGSIASALSGFRGLVAEPTNATRDEPDALLELWSFDMSPYSRLVRERLCELEVAYKLINVAKERWQDFGPAVLRLKPGKYEPLAGGKRAKLYQAEGIMQMPYLIDPNTGTKMAESEHIVRYLDQTYGAAAS